MQIDDVLKVRFGRQIEATMGSAGARKLNLITSVASIKLYCGAHAEVIDSQIHSTAVSMRGTSLVILRKSATTIQGTDTDHDQDALGKCLDWMALEWGCCVQQA